MRPLFFVGLVQCTHSLQHDVFVFPAATLSSCDARIDWVRTGESRASFSFLVVVVERGSLHGVVRTCTLRFIVCMSSHMRCSLQ